VLAAFVAANTFSALWHDHSHDEHVAVVPCDHEHHDHAGACEEHGAATSVSGQHHHAALHDDDCAVCRFVGQRSHLAASSAAVQSCPLAQRVELLPRRVPAETYVPAARPRAPPLPGV
jgi:hypothetical protein